MRMNGEIMGLMYVNEQTSPLENIVEKVEVHDKNGIFYVSFFTGLHTFDMLNRNSRLYKAYNIEDCLKTERIVHFLKHGGWYGEMNHPISSYKDKPLSPDRIKDIAMGNTSHRMLNPHIQGNLLVSDIETDAGTDAGMNLAKKMVQGFIPGFSCRAIATITDMNGKPTVIVRLLITYDWVFYNSDRNAEQNTSAPTKFNYKSPKLDVITESTVEKDMAIPLKDILTGIGKTNINAQVIMESFDLNDSDIYGLSQDKEKVIIRDNNNMIYCALSHDERNRVNDLFMSF